MSGNVSLTFAGPIAWLALDRVEQKNAITLSMWRKIAERAEQVGASDAKVMVLRGQGGFYCAGADLDELTKIDELDDAREYWAGMKSALDALNLLEIPKIAMIEKYCLGGGCILSLTCDLRYATKETVFGIPVAKHGFMLDTATVTRLTTLIGPARTKELVFLADTISGEEAQSMGLVNRLFAADQIESEVTTIATKISSVNVKSARHTKRQVDRIVAALICEDSLAKLDDDLIVERFLSSNRTP